MNDLSDEAFYEFVKKRNCEYTIDIWREAHRRAEQMLAAKNAEIANLKAIIAQLKASKNEPAR
jgi:hypothetical protein